MLPRMRSPTRCSKTAADPLCSRRGGQDVALRCRTGWKPCCNAATDVGGVITSTVTPLTRGRGCCHPSKLNAHVRSPRRRRASPLSPTTIEPTGRSFDSAVQSRRSEPRARPRPRRKRSAFNRALISNARTGSSRPSAVVSASPGAIGGFGANHHLRQSLAALNAPTMPTPEIYIGGADKLASEKSVAVLTEIGLPVMTLLLSSFKDTDMHEPYPLYRLFARIMPSYADGISRTQDILRLANGQTLRGKLVKWDLTLDRGTSGKIKVPIMASEGSSAYSPMLMG